jgi:superfamily II DNA or RNA helicase
MEPPKLPHDSPSVEPDSPPTADETELLVTFDPVADALLFEWVRMPGETLSAKGKLTLADASMFFRFSAFSFQFDPPGIGAVDRCGLHSSSIGAMLRRVRKGAPAASILRVGVRADRDLGPARAGAWHGVVTLPASDGWKWLGKIVCRWGEHVERLTAGDREGEAEPDTALRDIVAALLGVGEETPAGRAPRLLGLRIIADSVELRTQFDWMDDENRVVATGVVRGAPARMLQWELFADERDEPPETLPGNRAGVSKKLGEWVKRFRTDQARIAVIMKKPPPPGRDEPEWIHEPPFRADEPAFPFIVDLVVSMAEEHAVRNSPLGRLTAKINAEEDIAFQAYAERARRKAEKRAAQEARHREKIAQFAEQRRRRDERRDAARATAEAKRESAAPPAAAPASARPRAPVPPVLVSVRMPPLDFQDTAFPLQDLQGFALRERAALWWVSNQSDDLLCLPHCRIQRLEYQERTALRVLGALRGRALLSDEVGLGKTIEAGLVTKELLTRGMVKRFLVLTLPSLVDQWAGELEEKFGLATATTNQAEARGDAARFWRENAGIVASLHTLKQPAHLAIARQVHWDLLIVDEAHHLRNRSSQAWQAVNALPRQFLLLLTATPVQNSLEELYNLVTLLQPGQLPTPKEFRARFVDPQRPRQPREPAELRRLLGQVMIRNTRANAGVELPPRRAETAVFSPEPREAEFWREWEDDFRARLAALSASQASLWGRLLLQAAGSSPAAWRAALEKFPDAAAAGGWRDRAPLDASWRRKCESLVPLARGENGAVIFTQFLQTQAAVADFLRAAGGPVFVINGATPAPERQPITEEFRRRGGALLLTHSGTEGRNLQFCRTLANFDLPWNPMEIEQRIGRLHRLGQRHPVSIYNFVQAGTLQEHLLQVLQEKLNLFELVVGETGLVLGERFSGDEFEEEIFRRWQNAGGKSVAAAIADFGEELAAARGRHEEVKQLDTTLFAQDFES